jgi:hypothetical protein
MTLKPGEVKPKPKKAGENIPDFDEGGGTK